jgi:uncharacterized protein (TIGR03083 family)
MYQVQVSATMSAESAQDAVTIPALRHEEAILINAEEYKRFFELVTSLADDDWNKQTACSLWTVQDIVAHQAAHVVSFTSLGSFFSQLNPLDMWPYLAKGMSILDAWNQSQVELRESRSPQELIDEIRNAMPQSLQGRDKIPAWLRGLTLPLPGFDQPRSMGYLFDLIYTRDMWMHRVDICSATGRKMPLDSSHDARINALIVRDLAMKSKSGLNGRSAILQLTGTAGGTYRIGQNLTADTTIEIDTLDFCILTSGREKAANLLMNENTHIHGDIAFGRAVLNFCENRVLF